MIQQSSVEVSFSIPYVARQGGHLVVHITDGLHRSHHIAMKSAQYGLWQICVRLSKKAACKMSYRFTLEQDNCVMDEEMPRHLHYATIDSATRATIFCFWVTTGDQAYRYTSAFMQCINKPIRTGRRPVKSNIVRMVANNYQPPIGYHLVLTGEGESLGNWDPARGIVAHPQMPYSWAVELDSSTLPPHSEYKYVLISDDKQHVIWQEGPNYHLHLSSSDSLLIIEQPVLPLPQRDERIAGVVAPLFSLRSEQSWGVGDIGDLRKLIDWCISVGLHVVQLLPLTDTTRTGTWTDSYPYSAVSAFALHPMYMDLSSMKIANPRSRQRFEARRCHLNSLVQLDYEKANRLKLNYIHQALKDKWQQIAKRKDYQQFAKDNAFWLEPYCAYRVLTDHFRTADFTRWPQMGHYEASVVSPFIHHFGLDGKMLRQRIIQYLLYQQLTHVHQYARSRGVILKGDLPIGLNRHSADVWVHPEYFHLDQETGAPPDYFSRDGQDWGFPTYNWDNILADQDGQWFKKRIHHMSHFFDAFRIDHVLGFFRIWEIPVKYGKGLYGHFSPDLPLSEQEIRDFGFKGQIVQAPDKDNTLFFAEPGGYYPAIAGQQSRAYKQLPEEDRRAYSQLSQDYYYVRHNRFWRQVALRRFPLVVNSSEMLVCAEDLGMVPACVGEVMNHFKILSLEIQSMPKRPEGQFGVVANNPRLSVDTISTHDMEPLRLWWQRHRHEAQTYYNLYLGQPGNAPALLTSELAGQIIRLHLDCPSQLCIIALQDWLGMDPVLRNPNMAIEQINQPADPHHYWGYRMHITLEQLASATHFCHQVRQLVLASHRFV